MSQSKFDLAFLDQHSKTLFDHAEQILSNPKLFAAYSPEIYMKMAYVTGGGLLPLGILLELWKMDQWTAVCGACQGKILIHHLGGSPLSGACVWRGLCVDCGKVAEEGTWSGSEKYFSSQGWPPVMAARKRWNVSTEFGFEKLQSRNSHVNRIEVQGGMTIDTDDGSVDFQIQVKSQDESDRMSDSQPPMRASIPLRWVLDYLTD